MQKRVNFVGLVKSFQTNIYMHLQNSASIQPRTSLSKFTKNYPKVRIQVRKNIGEAAPGAADGGGDARGAEDVPHGDSWGYAHLRGT